MANGKKVPNQKEVVVNKEKCNKENLYATINLAAMDKAAQDLDAGAFKLWMYFTKNQNGYKFALSSKAVERDFGIKIKQYNNAIKELTDKGYLVHIQGDSYEFHELTVITKEDNVEIKENHVITKGNNDVITKEDNDVITKGNNTLLPKVIRNNTYNTTNNTIDTTMAANAAVGASGQWGSPIMVDQEWIIERYNDCAPCTNGMYKYQGKFYKVKPQA